MREEPLWMHAQERLPYHSWKNATSYFRNGSRKKKYSPSYRQTGWFEFEIFIINIDISLSSMDKIFLVILTRYREARLFTSPRCNHPHRRTQGIMYECERSRVSNQWFHQRLKNHRFLCTRHIFFIHFGIVIEIISAFAKANIRITFCLCLIWWNRTLPSIQWYI